MKFLTLLAASVLSAAPPMGWVCRDADEKLIRDAASAIVANGMKAAGYINVYAPGGAALKHFLQSKGLRLAPLESAPAIDGLPTEEQRSLFTLWAMQAAPLTIDGDPRNMSATLLSIVLNREAIAINQDPLNQPASLLAKQGEIEIWTRTLNGGRTALALFNRGADTAAVRVRWPDLGLKGKRRVRDLWARRNLGALAESYAATLAPRGAVLLIVD